MDNENHINVYPYSWTGPRRYMSKAQRACDFCRSRKSACQIDTAPPCRLCRVHAQPCEFTNRMVRKRRRISQYTSPQSVNVSNDIDAGNQGPRHESSDSPSLVQRQDLAESPVHDASSNIGDQLLAFNFDRRVEDSHTSVMHRGDRPTMDELMLSMYDGQGLAHIEPNFALGQPSLDNHPSLTSQLCGLTGDMDPYVLRHYQFDAKSEFTFSKLAIRTVQDTEVPVQFLLSKPDLSNESKVITKLEAPGDLEQSPDLSQIVAPEIGQRLIQLFLRFVNRQFPILSVGKLPDPLVGPTHLLAAIYSITQPFTTFDEYLCIELVYSPPSPQTLFRIAWRSLNDALAEPTIQSVQAALILLLHSPSNPLLLDSTVRWALLGMTVSMAQTLGLHLDPTLWNLPSGEIRTRRRLSWVVFAIDKWLAFSFGRPCHISRNDWLIAQLDPSDVEIGSLGDHVHSYAHELSKLTTILDNVLTSLYSLRSLSVLSKDFRLTMSNARPLMQDLTMWYTNLPPLLSNESNPEGRESPDDSASLHLAYQSVKILILRALLRPFNNTDDHSTELENNEEWRCALSQIRKTASAEADAAVGLVSSLRPSHYQAFWAPWSKTCFACIVNLLFLLAVTARQQPSPDPVNPIDEYEQRREALDRARTIFRLHAKSLDIIRFALLRIDAVFWIGWERVLGFS